jgi:hypothetical protein
MAGHDPQVERGVREALRLLATALVKIPPEPMPPVTVGRP